MTCEIGYLFIIFLYIFIKIYYISVLFCFFCFFFFKVNSSFKPTVTGYSDDNQLTIFYLFYFKSPPRRLSLQIISQQLGGETVVCLLPLELNNFLNFKIWIVKRMKTHRKTSFYDFLAVFGLAIMYPFSFGINHIFQPEFPGLPFHNSSEKKFYFTTVPFLHDRFRHSVFLLYPVLPDRPQLFQDVIVVKLVSGKYRHNSVKHEFRGKNDEESLNHFFYYYNLHFCYLNYIIVEWVSFFNIIKNNVV